MRWCWPVAVEAVCTCEGGGCRGGERGRGGGGEEKYGGGGVGGALGRKGGGREREGEGGEEMILLMPAFSFCLTEQIIFQKRLYFPTPSKLLLPPLKGSFTQWFSHSFTQDKISLMLSLLLSPSYIHFLNSKILPNFIKRKWLGSATSPGFPSWGHSSTSLSHQQKVPQRRC